MRGAGACARERGAGPRLREGWARCGKCVCDLAVDVRAKGRHGEASLRTRAIQRWCWRLGWVANVRVCVHAGWALQRFINSPQKWGA